MLKLKQILSSIFILFCLFFCSTIWAQNSGNINIPVGQITIKNLIQIVEKQTDYSFVFDNSINLDKTVQIKGETKNINSILKQLFDGREIAYEIVGTQIILKRQRKIICQKKK